MAAVHIFIFGEIAGCKIVPYIATHVKKTLTLSQTSPGFYVSAVEVFGKHCGKRRNCS